MAAAAANPTPPRSTPLQPLGSPRVITTCADVSSREALAHFASEALSGLGGCDVLVHNAGGGGPGNILSQDEETFEADFRYAFDVNVMAAARLARHAADALRESGGVIILVSSAWRLRPGSEMPASYGAAKAALDDLTGSLARHFGPQGVRVVGIAPGPIWTETWDKDLAGHATSSGRDLETLRSELIADAGGATALGRPGTMEEVARAVEWASSPSASYITGTTLLVDGGFVAGT